MTDPDQAAKPELSREETAHYIRSIWEALLAPKWKRDDLIDLGKAIYAKCPLVELDDDLFARFMPNLAAMAEKLHLALGRKPAPKAIAPVPAPAPIPVPTPKEEDHG